MTSTSSRSKINSSDLFAKLGDTCIMPPMAIKSFLPCHGLLLILPDAEGKVGSLFLPANAKTMPTSTGTVVAVGPGDISMSGNREPMDMPIGARVLVRNSGESHPHIKVDGVDHILVRFGDVLGTIED